MREPLVRYLCCPRCHAERLRLSPAVSRDAREIREGSVACEACAQVYPIEAGIIDLLYDPPDFVKREAAGLARFAEAMRQGGWDRKKILSLPHLDDDAYWAAQATSMEQILASVAFQPGERLLDVGSNTCWASNIFARRGLEVVALDIATTEMAGLGTAEYFFEGTDTCFDRVVGIMFALPFASGSFDYVFCCEVLHHNDPRTLRQTFRECHRVLKPGGRLLVLNETLRTLLESKAVQTARHAGLEAVAQYEGYEHVYFFHDYWLGAKRAGFAFDAILEPPYHKVFNREPILLEAETPVLRSLKLVGAQLIRRHRWSRRLYQWYLNLVRGGVSLNMVCRKPGDPPERRSPGDPASSAR